MSSFWLGIEIPIGMKLNPWYRAGLAWDDFDRFLDTTTGKEILHDTVGITYQTIKRTFHLIFLERNILMKKYVLQEKLSYSGDSS